MINILHLLWILPVTFAAGLVAGGMVKIGKREKWLRAEYERWHREAEPPGWEDDEPPRWIGGPGA